MKKRIFIIVVAVVLILGIILFLLRNVIIGHAFEVSINKKTNQTITFNIGHVDYSIINSSISFTDSKFSFNNTYINKEETVELSEFKFDELKLEDFSLFHLIFNRALIAKKFIIEKPSSWFRENNKPLHFKEKPKKIIRSLKEHPGLLGNLIIKVDEIEITHGKVDIKSLFDNEDHDGSVEFKLLLKNFDTSKEQIFKEDRFLFAKEHFVKLSNLIYTLPNGDQVSFDSTVFSSNTNTLVVNNIKIISSSVANNIMDVNATVREILIEGIDLDAMEKMHDIDIDNISISDAYLYLTKNSSDIPKVSSDSSKNKRNPNSFFHNVKLGSFSLKNINLLNRDELGDTLINAANLNFSVSDILLDSNVLVNKIPDVNYGSITMSSGELRIAEKKSGLKLKLSNLLFNEKEGIISLAGLQINDKSDEKSTSVFSEVDSIKVTGVSAEDFAKGLPLKIGLSISNPIVDLDISKMEKQKGTRKKVDLTNFEISNVEISNGKIHVAENNKFDIRVTDLDLNSGSIKLGDLNKIHKVVIKDFEITGCKVDLNLKLKNNAIKIKSGLGVTVDNITIADNKDTTWLKNLLWNIQLSEPVINYQDYLISCSKIVSNKNKEILLLENITLSDNPKSSLKNRMEVRELNIRSIDLTGVKYNTIIEKQTPVVGSISIENLYVDLRIDTRIKKPIAETGTLSNKKNIPFDIEEFIINNLSFKIETQDSISVSNFSLSELDFKYKITSSDNVVEGLDYLNIIDFLYSDSIKNSYAGIKKLNFDQPELKLSISDIKGGSINKLVKSENFMSYTSSGVEISGIEISETTPHNVSIKGIEIDDFVMDMEDHKTTKSASSKSDKKQIKLPDFLNNLNIDIFSAGNIDLIHSTISDTSVKKLTLTKAGFVIDFIKIDSKTFSDNNFAFAEKVSVNLRDTKFISANSLYETSINSLSYNFSENELSVDTLKMKPRYEAAEFFKKAVYQTGKMDLVTDKIICSNFRLKKLIKDGSIHMGGVDVMGLDASIYRDKKYDMNPEAYVKMPQEALLSSPRTLTIDSLRTHDAYIKYQELEKKAIKPGEIFLNNFNLSVFNINNDRMVIDSSSEMVANLNAMLLGEAQLNLKVKFPLLSPAYDFYVSGSIDEIDFSKVNPMTQPAVGVTMKTGTGSIDIPMIHGNNKFSEGSLLFKYENLKIELYDRDKAENATGLGGSIADLLLNDIFIKSNNPDSHGKTTPGEVYFKHDTQKSIAYYIWKSVLSGILSTMGYNNKEQRYEKQAVGRKSK
ncbi:MAG: hypothetical protein H8E34_01255 [Bacteroidetes bacterium]|nr:hypothetical protein [Bacteroidota bacterium]MBL6943062.1 hypothetical protein [Bacteroidales bacterium]